MSTNKEDIFEIETNERLEELTHEDAPELTLLAQAPEAKGEISNVKPSEENFLADVFQGTGGGNSSNPSGVNESLAVLSSTALYGDIYEMEMSDMDISDTDQDGREARKGAKFSRRMAVEERQTREGVCVQSGREEGEITPELTPQREIELSDNKENCIGVKSKSPKVIQEYYDHLGKLFSEAKRMSAEIRERFSQIFTEEQLKAVENQMNFSLQGIADLQNSDEKKEPDSKSVTQSSHRRSRTASRSRYGKRRSSHHSRSRRGRYSRSPRKRSRSHGTRSRHRSRSRGRETTKYESSTKEGHRSHGTTSHSRPSTHSTSNPWSIKKSGTQRKSPSPRSFLKENVDNRRESYNVKPTVILDGKEKQRVQTLVTRQMKFISQHMDNTNAKPIPGGNARNLDLVKSTLIAGDFKASHEREPITKPTDIRTLQDLEHFLEVLKDKNRKTILNDEEIFAQVNKLRHRGNIQDQSSMASEENLTRILLKEMDNFPEKNKGLYFQSSKSKFKDTFKEQESKRSNLSGEAKTSLGREIPNSRSRPHMGSDRKNVPRNPVKFEMKNSRNVKRANLFSNPDGDSTGQEDEGMIDSPRADTTEDKMNSPGCRSLNKDKEFDKNSSKNIKQCNTMKQTNMRDTDRRDRFASSERSEKKKNDFRLMARKDDTPRNTERSEKYHKKTSSPEDSQEIDISTSEKESDDEIQQLMLKKKKLEKEYAMLCKKVEEEEMNANELDDDKKLESEIRENSENPKVKSRKRIVILGSKNDLKKLVISPTLRDLLMTGKMQKKGVILKLVKNNKHRTIEEVKQGHRIYRKHSVEETEPPPKLNLEELEEFVGDLRQNRGKDLSQDQLLISDFMPRESRFLDRHRAKRKAKLMACITLSDKGATKEARLLESMMQINPKDDLEKTKMLKRLKEENEAVMLSANQTSSKSEQPKILNKINATEGISEICNEDSDNKADVSTPPDTSESKNDSLQKEIAKKNSILSSKKAQELLNRAKRMADKSSGSLLRKKRVCLSQTPKDGLKETQCE